MGMFALSVALYYFSYDHISAPPYKHKGKGQIKNSSGAGRVLVSLPCDLEGSAWRKDEKERDMLELNRIKVGLPYLSATDDASISTITTATATATGGQLSSSTTLERVFSNSNSNSNSNSDVGIAT